MDISEILGSLSQDDIKNLQSIASSIMGDQPQGTNRGTTQNTNQGGMADNFSQAQNPFSDLDLNAFSNIAAVMSKLNTSSDPRCRLIMSLRPMLSPERQKRADEAMKILKIIELVPVLRDSGLLKGVL